MVAFNGAVTSAAREWAAVGTARVSANDAELALHRFAAGGPEALTATCGPYALAVVDPRDDSVWLARDPEGEKPLFAVTRRGVLIAFASSVSALRALGLDVRLGDEGLAQLLLYGFHLGPQIEGAGLELHGNWRGVLYAPRAAAMAPVESGSPAEANGVAPTQLRARLDAAVTRCATAEVPVGLCLSGGVDSSCMAASLARAGRSVPAYQLRARGAPDEERGRAERVARHTGHELRRVDVGAEVLDALPRLTRCTGLPHGDPSVLALHAVARAARDDGVKVLLSGEGADDQWLGYRRDRAAAWLPARGWSFVPQPGLRHDTVARFLRALGSPTPFDRLLEATPPRFLAEVVAPGALPEAALPDLIFEPALSRARYAERAFYLRHDLLPKGDTATMAAGVEGRLPFLDPAVLTSAETRSRDARHVLGKVALRRAYAADLPPGILGRPKLGFGLPLDRWLRGDLWLVDVLRDRRTLARPHLRGAGVACVLDWHRAGRANLGHGLYLLAAYEIYLRELEAAA